MIEVALGIDVGGSSTRVRAAAEGGRVSSTVQVGSANPLTNPPDVVTLSLERSIHSALIQVAERSAIVRVALVAGVAGLGPARCAEFAGVIGAAFARAWSGRVEMAVETRPDTEIAFAAGTAASDGFVVIAGTGANAAHIIRRRQVASVDGHGWRLGDAGSGYWIGERLVRYCLESLDGRMEATSLTEAVVTSLGLECGDRAATRWAIVDRLMAAHPAEIAALAPIALGNTHAVGVRLCAEAALELGRSLRALGPAAGDEVVLAGGLLERPPIAGLLAAALARDGLGVRAAARPVDGALRLAQALLRSE